MTTLILLTLHGRPFRAEASISQAELPAMRQDAGMVGYIARVAPDAIGSPVADLPQSATFLSYINE